MAEESIALERGGRIPPQNIDAEESVLGGVLLKNDAMDEIDFLEPEDFYREKHRKIFIAMQELSDRGEPIDLVTLGTALKDAGDLERVGGEAFLAYLAGRVPTAANVVYYARLVRDKGLFRHLIDASTQIAADSYEADEPVKNMLDKAEAKILEIGERQLHKPFSPIREVVRNAFKHIERLQENHQDITGVPTGFADVDHLLSGLQPTDLIILAARPSMGKTSLALNIAQNAAVLSDMPVAVFSLEMSSEQLVMRMLSSEARIDSAQMRRGFLSEKAIGGLIDAASTLSDAPIYIDDTPGITPLELKAKARRIKRLAKEAEMGLVVVDYLQLMQAPRSSDNRAQEVAEISRSLKGLAKELGWPVLALSQLNRGVEARVDKRPMLSDLRESGAIEQDADIVAFIYRDSHYNENAEEPNKAELIIAKNRSGATKTIPLTFLKEYTTFVDYTDAGGYGAAGGDYGGYGGDPGGGYGGGQGGGGEPGGGYGGGGGDPGQEMGF